LVATIGSRVIGTASLDESVARIVFVAPNAQAEGIGKLLMAEVESTARERNIRSLTVPSAVIAEPFCARPGFKRT
jgi:GNAT superfamily N-acetyltransferase